MHVIVPHIGKSHLTYACLQSIPDEHHVVLVDASYVADMETFAQNRRNSITYVRPDKPLGCLARNWNLGAAEIPDSEDVWMFCASDVQFYAESWRRLSELLRCFPDCGIIRDRATNWNVWVVRRWAWKLLAPMDERYKPCGGEDDDLVAKCYFAGIRICAGWIGVNHLEGGHATRIDIARPLAKTTWDHRHKNIAVFRRKWCMTPSLHRDVDYRAAHDRVHVRGRRKDPPEGWDGHSIPTSRAPWPERQWPDPLRLNLGCGRRLREGWVNIDVNPKTNSDLCLDVTEDQWPFEDGSVERIVAYHLLEHLSRDDGRELLARCHQLLKPGGVLVVETPDLEGVVAKFPGSQRRMLRSIYGDQSNTWRRHRWGFSRDTIRLALKEAGFQAITTGPGTDYHAETEPCLRAEAVR